MNYAERMQHRYPVPYHGFQRDTSQIMFGHPIVEITPPTEEQERENTLTRIADSN